MDPNKHTSPTPAAPASTQDSHVISQRIPQGSWDSHMHVVDAEAYPLDQTAAYRPNPHTLQDALDFESSVGIDNIVLVQPSIYGHDNSCLLDALRELGPRRGRGVISFDPLQTTTEQLQEWHNLGVRGVRLNIQSNTHQEGAILNAEELAHTLRSYADAIRHLGWVMQVYVPMPMIELLEPIIPTLNVKFCIDHLGFPVLNDHRGGGRGGNGDVGSDPYALEGFSSLSRLLQAELAYVKLSAPYRISQAPGFSSLEPVAKELLRLKGSSHVVFATDWPHTRFEGWDVKPWMEKVLDWCEGDEELIERLFKGNAVDLWDV